MSEEKQKEINILDMKEIDFEKIGFKKPCKLGAGRLAYICYDMEDYLYFHFPAVRLPFDMKANRWNGYNLSMEFDEGSKRQSNFLQTIRSIDDFMIKSIEKYSQSWFGKQYSEEEVRHCYASPIREQPPFKPKISPKVIFTEKELKTNIYNAQNEPMVMEDKTLENIFKKGKYVMGILQISGLWINAEDTRVSPVMKLTQVKVMEPPVEKKRAAGELLGAGSKRLKVSALRQLLPDDDDDDMRTVIGGMP